MQFREQLVKIIETLEYISDWNDTAASFKAKTLLLAIHNVQFVVALHCQLSVFSLCLPFSRLFQKKTLYLTGAGSLVSDLLSILKNQHVNCNEEFFTIFAAASDVL